MRVVITEMRERKEAKEKAREKAIKSMVEMLTPTPPKNRFCIFSVGVRCRGFGSVEI